jgi:hypothetical protein
MSELIGFVFGLCAGAGALASFAAFDLLYLMTGKLLVPGKGGLELITREEAIDGLEALIEQVAEEQDE